MTKKVSKYFNECTKTKKTTKTLGECISLVEDAFSKNVPIDWRSDVIVSLVDNCYFLDQDKRSMIYRIVENWSRDDLCDLINISNSFLRTKDMEAIEQLIETEIHNLKHEQDKDY